MASVQQLVSTRLNTAVLPGQMVSAFTTSESRATFMHDVGTLRAPAACLKHHGSFSTGVWSGKLGSPLKLQKRSLHAGASARATRMRDHPSRQALSKLGPQIAQVQGYASKVSWTPHRQYSSKSALSALAAVAQSSAPPATQDYRSAPETLKDVPEIKELLTCNDKDVLHLFFLVFCSQGVGMTEQVEMWIRRAGQKCLAMADEGTDVRMLRELGGSLLQEALEEAGHDKWFRTDVRQLSESWNAAHPDNPVSAEQLLTSEAFKSVRDYVAIHEKYVDSEQAYCQIAIKSAIEQLSLLLGAPMVGRVRALFGDSFLRQLSFLDHHVELDETHAEESARARDDFLRANPDLEPLFAEATYATLDIYGRFLVDCYSKAKEMRAGW